jgi:hypothetical protein
MGGDDGDGGDVISSSRMKSFKLLFYLSSPFGTGLA